MKILPLNPPVAVIEGDSHISRWVEQHGRLDIARDLIATYAKHIPEGGVVADVGACIGDHTVTYRQLVGYTGTVHAFECNPAALECLRFNLTAGDSSYRDASDPDKSCFQLGHTAMAVLHPYALGATSGFARVQQDPNAGASHLTGAVNGCGVEIKPLDEVAADWTRLDFLKIDAEGFEPFILAGGKQTILRLRPAMFIEVNAGALARYGQTPHTLIALIMSLGYATIPEPLRAKITDPQYDLLCLPQSLPSKS